MKAVKMILRIFENMAYNNPLCPEFGSTEYKELKLHGRHKCAETLSDLSITLEVFMRE